MTLIENEYSQTVLSEQRVISVTEHSTLAEVVRSYLQVTKSLHSLKEESDQEDTTLIDELLRKSQDVLKRLRFQLDRAHNVFSNTNHSHITHLMQVNKLLNAHDFFIKVYEAVQRTTISHKKSTTEV